MVTITPTVNESDMDDDGLPDTWERAYAPELALLAPNSDSDGDGLTDEDERQMGTSPLDLAIEERALPSTITIEKSGHHAQTISIEDSGEDRLKQWLEEVNPEELGKYKM